MKLAKHQREKQNLLHPVRRWFVAITLTLTSAALNSCAPVLSASVEIGPITYTLNIDRSLFDGYTDNSGGSSSTFATISCDASQTCSPLLDYPVACVNSVCTPDPLQFVYGTDPAINLDNYPVISQFSRGLTTMRLTAVRYTATSQALTASIGPTELYWGPESAVAINQGTSLLGTMPELSVTPGQQITGNIQLDPAGSERLSVHLATVSHRFRLFARPTVLVRPGQVVPAGTLVIQITPTVSVQAPMPR